MQDLEPIKIKFLSFPNINPVAFSIGPFHIHWYGLGYLLGISLAFLYSKRLVNNYSLWANKRPPLNYQQLSDFILWATLGIIIGGRLGDVLLWEPCYYLQHPSEIIAIWHGGMAFHGGLIGVILACILYAYLNNINCFSLLDITCAGAPIGLGIVRLCNFINGELWGKASTLPWAMIFPKADSMPRHPSQIYEAIMEGAILFIILFIAIYKFKTLKRSGLTAGLFCVLYSIARIVAEFFREKDVAPLWFENIFNNTIFSYGVFLCLPMLGVGLILIIYASKKKHAN